MEHVVLLIGALDWHMVGKTLSRFPPTADYRVQTYSGTAGAKSFLRFKRAALFILDVGLGYEACMDFLHWLVDNRPTYGFLLGNQIDNILAINGLNSRLVIDALHRPATESRWAQALCLWDERRRRYSESHLDSLKGMAICWYDRSAGRGVAALAGRERI